jgi:hypothetical protein
MAQEVAYLDPHASNGSVADGHRGSWRAQLRLAPGAAELRDRPDAVEPAAVPGAVAKTFIAILTAALVANSGRPGLSAYWC